MFVANCHSYAPHFAGFDTYVRNLNVYLHNLRAEEEVRIFAFCRWGCPFILHHTALQESKAKKKSAPQPNVGGGAAQ
jgi:hypothetical protein